MSISALLQREFHEEIKGTRKTLEALPVGNTEFKPHLRSSALAKLAGHMAQLPAFVSIILTAPDVDMSVTKLEPLIFETKPQVLAASEESADCSSPMPKTKSFCRTRRTTSTAIDR